MSLSPLAEITKYDTGIQKSRKWYKNLDTFRFMSKLVNKRTNLHV